ncbi:MAG: hypothetical protein HYY67_00675 [Thaumarchaeota archaeon]|nr:hypothetical protein [Nitrososphaerota archaeon]
MQKVSANHEEDLVNPAALRKILGDSAMVRLLDFLTTNRRLDYSKTEIAKYSGIGWKTIFKLWPMLEKYNLVKLTRKVGRAKLYRLNIESPIAKTLDRLALQIADFDNEPLIKKQIMQAASQ